MPHLETLFKGFDEFLCRLSAKQTGWVEKPHLPTTQKNTPLFSRPSLVYRLAQNIQPAHIRLQGGGNLYRTVGLLVVFDECDECAPDRQPRAVQGVD